MTELIIQLGNYLKTTAYYEKVLSTLPTPLNNVYIGYIATTILSVVIITWIVDHISSYRFNRAITKKHRQLAHQQATNDIKQAERDENERIRREERERREEERYESEQRRQAERDRRADEREDRRQRKMDSYLEFVMAAKQINSIYQYMDADQFRAKQQSYDKYIENVSHEKEILYDEDGNVRPFNDAERKRLIDKEMERITNERIKEAQEKAEAEKEELLKQLQQQAEENERLRWEAEEQRIASAVEHAQELKKIEINAQTKRELAEQKAVLKEKAYKEVKEELEQTNAILEQKQNEIDNMKLSQTDKENSIQKAKEKIEELTRALEEARQISQNNQPSSITTILQEQLTEMQEMLSTTIQSKEEIQSKLEHVTNESVSLREDLDAKNNMIKQLQEESQIAKKEIEAKLKEENEAILACERAKTNAEAEALRAKISMYEAKEKEQAEIEKLKAQAVSVKKEEIQPVTEDDIDVKTLELKAAKEKERQMQEYYAREAGFKDQQEADAFHAILMNMNKSDKMAQERQNEQNKEKREVQDRIKDYEDQVNEEMRNKEEVKNAKKVTYDEDAIKNNQQYLEELEKKEKKKGFFRRK